MTATAKDQKLSKIEVSKKLLAATLFDLNPGRTVEEWEKYIEENGHDPKKFFGTNGEGYNEYIAFTSTYDMDKHKRAGASKLRNVK